MPHKKNCQCPPCRYRRGKDKGQAPRLSIRLEPAIRDYLLNHPDGARSVIERLVEQEMNAAKVAKKGRTTHLSDKSVIRRPPGPLDLWGAQFHQALEQTKAMKQLLAELGLDNLKGKWVTQQLRLGYCSPRGYRSEAHNRELERLGMVGPDGRETLAGCLTVPYLNPMGHVDGFYGVSPKDPAEDLRTGPGSGLLSTGPLPSELVVVDGVREAIACFSAGLVGVQALDLLTSGWLPVLAKHAKSVILATSDRARAETTARELRRLGVECRWLEVSDHPLDRQMLFQDGASLDGALQRAKPMELSRRT